MHDSKLEEYELPKSRFKTVYYTSWINDTTDHRMAYHKLSVNCQTFYPMAFCNNCGERFEGDKDHNYLDWYCHCEREEAFGAQPLKLQTLIYKIYYRNDRWQKAIPQWKALVNWRDRNATNTATYTAAFKPGKPNIIRNL